MGNRTEGGRGRKRRHKKTQEIIRTLCRRRYDDYSEQTRDGVGGKRTYNLDTEISSERKP